MLGKMKKMWANISQNTLSFGNFISIFDKNSGKRSSAPLPWKVSVPYAYGWISLHCLPPLRWIIVKYLACVVDHPPPSILTLNPFFHVQLVSYQRLFLLYLLL
jgi:hypothetical protein